jgi:hypothetical protein
MKCSSLEEPPCKPKIKGPASLADLVRDYIANIRSRARREHQYFRDMPSLDLAIHHAGLAVYRDGFKPHGREKRFDHQRRIPPAALKKSKAILEASKPQLRACRSFDDLLLLIRRLLSGVPRLGPLVVYDTAERLGTYLNLAPQRVYLHAGTKEGALELGLDASRGVIDVAELPKPIQTLSPREIENFLCIYKGYFGSFRRVKQSS